MQIHIQRQICKANVLMHRRVWCRMRQEPMCAGLHICALHTKHTAHLCTLNTEHTLHICALNTRNTAHCTVCDKKRCNKRTLHIALYVAHCALMCNKMHCGALHTKQTKHCPLHTDTQQEVLHHEHIALYVAHCALMRGKKQGIPEHCRTL